MSEIEKLTNFQKIRDEFNIAFGVKNNFTPQIDLFDKDPELVKYRLSLINEEVQELNDAISNKDFAETIDALADILYVVYGAASTFGINADDAFDLVHRSNMSKLCSTEKEAQETVEFYKKDGRYDSPDYRLAPNDQDYVVFNKSTKKILKSINYKPVSFESLM